MVFRVSGAALLLLLTLDFYSSSQDSVGDVSVGFYVAQAFILLGLFGSPIAAICGAYLGGAEYEWGTRPWRLVVDGGKVLCLARLLVIAAVGVATVVVSVSLGGFLDVVSGHGWYSTDALAIRVAYALGVGQFWGLVGFLIAALLRSFSWGAVIPVVWVVLEPLVSFYLPVGAARVLPMWNIKIVLHELFPDLGGAVAVILPAPGDSVESALIVAAYLTTALILSYAKGLRRDR